MRLRAKTLTFVNREKMKISRNDPRIALIPITRGIAEATSAPNTNARSTKVNGIAIDSASFKSFPIFSLMELVITPPPDA
jgi:hypothetical protein